VQIDDMQKEWLMKKENNSSVGSFTLEGIVDSRSRAQGHHPCPPGQGDDENSPDLDKLSP